MLQFFEIGQAVAWKDTIEHQGFFHFGVVKEKGFLRGEWVVYTEENISKLRWTVKKGTDGYIGFRGWVK